MTRREYWNERRSYLGNRRRGYLDDIIEIGMTGKGGAEITRREHWSDRCYDGIIGVGMDML